MAMVITSDPLVSTLQEIMMRYETMTKLTPASALAAAEQFFSGEFGLAVGRRGSQELGFEDGGGHVLVSVRGEHPTTLEIETREWDVPVTEFIGKLPR
jgi:hypothetical protein